MFRTLTLALFLTRVLAATTLSSPGSCAGPYQGYPGSSSFICAPLDDRTGTNLGVLKETTFSFVRTGAGIPIGEIASAVFFGTDDRYHLYYQATVFPNAPEPIDYFEAAAVLPSDPRVYPADVAIRKDAVAPNFISSSILPEFAAFSPSVRSAVNLQVEYVAPNGRCDIVTNYCPSIGSALSPGQSSVTFELTSSFPFAGWTHYSYASMSGAYSPLTGLNRYFADDVLVVTPAPEPVSSALVTLSLMALLVWRRRVTLGR